MTALAQTNGAGQQVLPGGTVQEDPAVGVNALLRAVRVVSENASSTNSAAEAKDFGAAALAFAQALVVLDPSLSQGGTPLAHDIALEQIRGQTQENVASIQGAHSLAIEEVRGHNALEQAKQTAAAPTPAKKKSVSVKRDPSGRAESYEMNEG